MHSQDAKQGPGPAAHHMGSCWATYLACMVCGLHFDRKWAENELHHEQQKGAVVVGNAVSYDWQMNGLASQIRQAARAAQLQHAFFILLNMLVLCR